MMKNVLYVALCFHHLIFCVSGGINTVFIPNQILITLHIHMYLDLHFYLTDGGTYRLLLMS